MPLYAQIFDSDLENHLGSGRTRALYSRYQRLLADEPTELPHINAVCADDCLGLEDWSCRLMLLPDGDYLYTSYGRELAKLTGFTMLGSRISSGSGSAFGFFRQSYARAAASRRPLVTHSAAVFAAGIASWIRLVLPVRDDAGHLSLFTLSKPIYQAQAMIGSLMQVIDDPVIIVQMVRDQGRDVIDARIVETNNAAASTFATASSHPAFLSDLAADFLSGALRAVMEAAYCDSGRAQVDEPFHLAGQHFASVTAARCGDGAVLRLKRA